jgi:hypothetical protein
MKTRAIKTLTLGATLILATLAMSPALADGTKGIKIRFAGGFIQNVLQAQVFPGTGIPNGSVESRSMALVKGRGTFGRVDIMAVTASGPPDEIPTTYCSSGLPPIAKILENNLVLTFGDLSLLYGNGSGIVCPNLADPSGDPLAEIEGTWDGGTGRFAHAGGEWSIRFKFARPVGDVTQFIAETGVIKGHITGLRETD